MARRKARDPRIVPIVGVRGTTYDARFQYKDEASGKWKPKPKRCKTVEEAEGYLAEMDRLHAQGRAVTPSKQLLGRAIGDWLDRKFDAGRIGEATLAEQQGKLASVYGPIFGVSLCDLREHHFEAQYQRIKQQGKPGGTYTAHAHSLLSGFFTRLVKRDQLARNPLEHVERPKPDPKPKHVWEWAQIARFLRHEEKRWMYPLWLLLFEKKMRVGECQALRWCDVEIDGPENTGKIHVSATVTRRRDPVTGKMRFVVGERAKTAESIRNLMIAWPLHRALRKHRDLAMFAARAFGRSWDDEQFIFPDPTDTTFLAQETIRYRLKAACKVADVPYEGCHLLRRTGISRALGDGDPLFYVMEEAGHVDPKTTKGYTQLSEAEHRKYTKRFSVRVHGERAADGGEARAGEAKAGD